MARIVAVLAHYAPDIVLLQEVDEGAGRSGHDHQTELFAQALGMPHRAFFPNVRVRGGGTYGNAVLSRHPIAAARNLDLTFTAKKRRGALKRKTGGSSKTGGSLKMGSTPARRRTSP